jgi:hypothetical protein
VFGSPPERSCPIPVYISPVIVGVTITAWLVIPRVVGSAGASADRSAAIDRLPGDSFGFARTGPDRSGADLSAEPNTDEWSSSWDYAGPDGPDSADDDRWYVPGGADNVSWSVPVGGPRSRPSSWSRGRPGR